MNQLGNDSATGDEVDHAEVWCADERLGEKGGEGGDAVNDNHGNVQESGFDGGGAAGDDGRVGSCEGVVGLIFDDTEGERGIPARSEVSEAGMRGRGDHKLGGALGVDAGAGFADDRQVLGEFGVAAAGEDGDQGPSGIEVVAAAKFFAGLRGVNGADERMADEFRGDAGIAEKSFLEGEDA